VSLGVDCQAEEFARQLKDFTDLQSWLVEQLHLVPVRLQGQGTIKINACEGPVGDAAIPHWMIGC
jgi:hypothetical protein